MFCNKHNVNQLTALLRAHGIQEVVACPGSRNGTLVHNFHELSLRGELCLYAVTDERSAAFAAIGLILATRRPAAVCVTSGSALLNTLPAVAEAFYRRLPLIVVSADRSAPLIGQLDGQTLPQPEALLPYARTFHLPEDDAAWCNRLCNEALLTLRRQGGQPVHINVPLSEPLFAFTTPRLPNERVIREPLPAAERPLPDEVMTAVATARLPLLLIGHSDAPPSPAVARIEAAGSLLVLPEFIANEPHSRRTRALETLLPQGYEWDADLVVHMGGTFVNKQLKQRLRTTDCRVIRLQSDDSFPDTFGRLDTFVRCDVEKALLQLADLPAHAEVLRQRQRLDAAADEPLQTEFTDFGVVQRLAARLPQEGIVLHAGNSSAVRLAARCLDGGTFPVFCNRGVNGIEGSLSVAAGYALASDIRSLVLIGDLSFFYDQNALWNKALRGNLRILLLNNGGGRIFDRLPGLAASPAHRRFVAADHRTTARGLCESYDIGYRAARNHTDLEAGLDFLLTAESSRPVLLEVFTEP